MANLEHLALLREGVSAWATWREENKGVLPNFSEAELSRANFSRADLSRANFSRADLREADLSGTDLREAHLPEADLIEVNLSGAKLSRAYLRLADLGGANLGLADLSWAALIEVNLRGANLRGANLHGGYLKRADLSGTYLCWADLSRADLRGVDLRRADLRGADLSEANLSGADLSGAFLGYGTFGNIDLGEVKGLVAVTHLGPSTIGIDTIHRSGGKIPEAFLRGAGVPDNFIAYMASLTGKEFEYYSVFISHASNDDMFARCLYADLQSNNVRCWFAPEDMKIGEPILAGIDSAIRHHDKLLLVLSETSIQSRWVEHEVMSATSKEYQQGRESRVLFPVRIDGAVMETDIPWAKTLRENRHIGDFTNWKDHDAYQAAFDRLLRDLKQSEQF